MPVPCHWLPPAPPQPLLLPCQQLSNPPALAWLFIHALLRCPCVLATLALCFMFLISKLRGEALCLLWGLGRKFFLNVGNKMGWWNKQWLIYSPNFHRLAQPKENPAHAPSCRRLCQEVHSTITSHYYFLDNVYIFTITQPLAPSFFIRSGTRLMTQPQKKRNATPA